MGLLEVLALLFVALKLMGYIDWSWWWVLSPLIAALSVYAVIFVGYLFILIKAASQTKRFK